MADFDVFIGFGLQVRSREVAANKVFGELMGLLGAQQAQGAVESFEPVFLQPHGGELGGFVLVRGERAKLDAMGRQRGIPEPTCPRPDHRGTPGRRTLRPGRGGDPSGRGLRRPHG